MQMIRIGFASALMALLSCASCATGHVGINGLNGRTDVVVMEGVFVDDVSVDVNEAEAFDACLKRAKEDQRPDPETYCRCPPDKPCGLYGYGYRASGSGEDLMLNQPRVGLSSPPVATAARP